VKLGFRLKLFLVSLGLTMLAFIGADVWLAPSFEQQLIAASEKDARALLGVMALAASSSGISLDDRVAWQAFARDLGQRAQVPVTIVRADGDLLGDSAAQLNSPPARSVYGDRAEIRAALEGGGPAEGHDEQMRYLAVAFRRDEKVAGVVRLAFSDAALEAQNDRVERLVLIESGAACAVAIVLWLAAAHWLVRVLRTLTAKARKMASGDLDVRTGIRGGDEFAELGDVLDQLAGNLSRAIHDLRDERDLQIAILDGMNEGVLVLDREGKIRRHNPAIRSMLLLPSDALGHPLADFVDRAKVEDILAGAGTRNDPFEIELGGLQPRRLLVGAATLPGDPASLVLVCRDVTEVRRLETLRRDFVANVSHELRTPVAAIRSAADTLGGAATRRPEAAGRFIEMVGRNAERLQRIIDNLLELSRIESKQLVLHREPIDLAPLVDHVLAFFRERAEQRGVVLAAEVPETARIESDARALEIVLTNLVDNAVKYCARAAVRVSFDAGDGRAELRVSDTGPGISEEHLPRLFERFYRVDASRSRELGGTGLGLSIVKHLVDAMGGAVSVTSEPGGGTTFLVCLPVRTEP
jgi:two-component system phosphate regulon sensor histidine kinase PhoR